MVLILVSRRWHVESTGTTFFHRTSFLRVATQLSEIDRNQHEQEEYYTYSFTR